MEEKIKILILTEDIIFPENKNGIAKTLFNVLKGNPRLDGSLYSPENNEIIPEGFSHITFKSFSSSGQRKVSFFSKVKSFLSKNPFIRANEQLISEVQKAIEDVKNQYDIIILCSLSMAPLLDNFSEEEKKKSVILAIDSYSYWFTFKVKNENNPFKKLIWWLEMKKGEWYEKKYYNKCALSLYVSRQDASHADSLGPTSAKKVGMRYGIDLEKSRTEFPKYTEIKKEENTLIFTGNLSYGPNLDAIHFLLNEVLPRVWKRKEDVKIYFIGGGAPEFLRNHSDKRIIVTGFVESLIPYMKKTTLFVSPLFFGAGTKTKVLEAMGYGKAVVGTQDSFTEIVCEDGKDCIVVEPAKDGNVWANTILELLDDPEKVRKIEALAKETIEKNHDWKVNKQFYVEELLKIKNS